MTPKLITKIGGALAASVALLALPAATSHAAEHYVAKLQPLNVAKIGTSASGTADLKVEDGTLVVTIDASGLTPGIMHLQHFHGFADGKDATCPTAEAETNGDGYIDLIETEPAAGTTLVPFHAHPTTLEIPSDTYPVADENGSTHYQQSVPVDALEKALKEKFQAPALALRDRVIIIHTIPSDAKLPDSVKSLPGVPAQVTIPVACGKIEATQ